MKDKIVLIGMPGCGKTTIGKILAEKLNYNFYDMDEYIERTNKKSIEEMFNQSEDKFRELETKACKELITKERVVISTGGGVVKRDVNIEILKDGFIVFINRPLSSIINDVDTDSRPLLKGCKENIYELYNERFSKYRNAANIEIDNEGLLSDTVDLTEKMLKGKIKE